MSHVSSRLSEDGFDSFVESPRKPPLHIDLILDPVPHPNHPDMMLLDGNKKVPLRPVSFKHDGTRFHCETTVKFCYSTLYDIRIASSPQRCITSFQIGVEGHTPERLDVNVPLDSNTCTGACRWLCNIAPSHKQERARLIVQLDVEDFGVVKIPLQIKVYSPYGGGSVKALNGKRLGKIRAQPAIGDETVKSMVYLAV